MSNWRFPGWRASALAGVLVLQLSGLSWWQLSRAEYKQAVADAIKDHPLQQHLSSDEVAAGSNGHIVEEELPNFAFRRVQLAGTFIHDQYFLIKNRRSKGYQGYWVIQPFEEQNRQRIWLINRGWIAAPKSGAKFPDLPATPGLQVNLEGLLWPQTALPLPNLEQATDSPWPMILRRHDIMGMSTIQPRSIPWEVRLGPEQPGVLKAADRQFPSDPGKHLAYAFQWFGIAALVVLGYAVLGFRKARRQAGAEGPAKR